MGKGTRFKLVPLTHMNLKTDSREEYWEYFCKGIADTMQLSEFGKKKKKSDFFLHFELSGL